MSDAVPRRAFVGRCAGWLGALALGGCASVAVRSVTADPGGIVALRLDEHPELTRPGGFVKLDVDGVPDPVYVLALDGGELVALSPICTHLGCTVEPEGALLVCPCHGSTYDRRGLVLQGPAEQPLARYPARRTGDGRLLIEVRPS